MIILKEIKNRNAEFFIIFENENGSRIEVPVDSLVAKQFSLVVERLSPPKPKNLVEGPG